MFYVFISSHNSGINIIIIFIAPEAGKVETASYNQYDGKIRSVNQSPASPNQSSVDRSKQLYINMAIMALASVT